MKPPTPAVTWGRVARRETLTLPAASTSRNERSARSKPPPWRYGELVRRRHERVRVLGAPEREPEERDPADRALLDHPGHRAVEPLLEEDPGHERGDAEAEVHGLPVPELLGRTPRDHLLRAPLGELEVGRRRPEVAGRLRQKSRLRRLELIRVDHHRVDEDPRDPDLLRRKRPAAGAALHLGDHDPAVVVGRERLVEDARAARPRPRVVRLPNSSAVVARMIATSTGMDRR